MSSFQDQKQVVASSSAASTEEPQATTASATAVESFRTFDDMALSDDVLRGIYSIGFEAPTVIQQQAIVPIIRGADVMMQAQSGTGKTGAFGVGVLARVDVSVRAVQALVLSPTRELAQQTAVTLAALGEYKGVRTHCAVGGVQVAADLRALRGATHVVCGTVGRIKQLLTSRALDTAALQVLVLDEVDVMLDVGFLDDVHAIFALLPRDVQAVVVSATFTDDITRIARQFLRQPVEILLPVCDVPLAGIKQYFVHCGDGSGKYSTLCDLYSALSAAKSLIFCNARQSAEQLRDMLTADQFSVSLMHSELSPEQRCDEMRRFRAGTTRVLIATDLLARGIDVQQVSMVVNFELPRDFANYMHRIGRGGRLGRKALAINLVAGPRDEHLLADIAQHYSISIPELTNDAVAAATQ